MREKPRRRKKRTPRKGIKKPLIPSGPARNDSFGKRNRTTKTGCRPEDGHVPCLVGHYSLERDQSPLSAFQVCSRLAICNHLPPPSSHALEVHGQCHQASRLESSRNQASEYDLVDQLASTRPTGCGIRILRCQTDTRSLTRTGMPGPSLLEGQLLRDRREQFPNVLGRLC